MDYEHTDKNEPLNLGSHDVSKDGLADPVQQWYRFQERLERAHSGPVYNFEHQAYIVVSYYPYDYGGISVVQRLYATCEEEAFDIANENDEQAGRYVEGGTYSIVKDDGAFGVLWASPRRTNY